MLRTCGTAFTRATQERRAERCSPGARFFLGKGGTESRRRALRDVRGCASVPHQGSGPVARSGRSNTSPGQPQSQAHPAGSGRKNGDSASHGSTCFRLVVAPGRLLPLWARRAADLSCGRHVECSGHERPRPHSKTPEEIERVCVPGHIRVPHTEGIDGVRHATGDAPDWPGGHDPRIRRSR